MYRLANYYHSASYWCRWIGTTPFHQAAAWTQTLIVF